MKEKLDEFVLAVAPALKAAFVKAAKVGAYIVLSAASAAVLAYVTKQNFDPSIMVAFNFFYAAAQKAIETLRAS